MSPSDKKILLVEDNPDDADLTIYTLQQNNLGSNITHLKNGVEALDYLFAKGKYTQRNLADMPQLVLLDIKLPKMNGIEVLRRIRENKLTSRLPVVMLTSSKDEQDVAKSYDSGSNAYVQKPITYNEFNHAINQLGIFWLKMNETAPNTLQTDD